MDGGPAIRRIDLFDLAFVRPIHDPPAARPGDAVLEGQRLELRLSELFGEADEGAAALMAEREQARAAKDYARADQIRDELAEMGLEVRDSADGPRLVPKS